MPIISSPYWDDIPGDVAIRKDINLASDLEELSEAYQPAKYIDRFYPTALLIQAGEIDQHYDISKLQNYYRELKQYYEAAPNRIKLIIYPDTKHEFKQEMWEQALRWLKDYL
jgi:hypothetical protein